MSGKLTWKKENGEWGLEGVDLASLPPAVYGALCKLKDIEHPSCPTNGDRIRAMSDEELSVVLECPHLSDPDICCVESDECSDGCDKCVLKWLQDPAEV